MSIIKMIGLIVVFVFSAVVLHSQHYIIAGFYDVNINIALLSMFWYGIWYGAK